MIRVEQEIPDQPAVEAMFRLADAASRALYPGEERVGPSTATLLDEDVRFFVARQDGTAVGCGGYVPAGPAVGELKRLFVHPEARRGGIGRMLLEAIAALARNEGFTRLRLETGHRAEAAIGLYRALGYHDTAPFGPYAADPSSRFMETALFPAPPIITP